MAKLVQHEVAAEVDGERVVGHYTLERRGQWERLTVWYRGRSADAEVAPEAEPGSAELVAQELLRNLAAGKPL